MTTTFALTAAIGLDHRGVRAADQTFRSFPATGELNSDTNWYILNLCEIYESEGE